ncbi:alpha/beta hydrolase family protein [Mucilaginibacter segetis]|uniref:Dienelactone hydrolase n=1 Tax=Mucilaginibacter segetis TaxID=2793071 RepID=A0A934UMK6_9SPHI|nr:hypothetical protein [Mucilaginibacter segetis]MBK0378981.1 hypothetical protein [Mucilaginibacter segetis]
MRVRNLLILLILPFAGIAQTKTINIGEQTFHFNDTTRKRPLITEIWYPTTDERSPEPKKNFPYIVAPTIWNAKLPVNKKPLIIISHGTGGSRMTLEWLADDLVKNGFIVAAVDHWGNTYDNKIAIDFVTPWERAQDISFVLTQLLNKPETNACIDQNRIGAAGFSIGGYTVIALAGAKLNLQALDNFMQSAKGKQEMDIPEFPELANSINRDSVMASFTKSPPLKDKRIKAVFAMCPAIGQGFPEKKQFKEVNVPLYIVDAESDKITPVETNAAHYHKMMLFSKLYVLPGKAGHYVFLNEATPMLKQSGEPIFNDDPTVDRHAVHTKVGSLAVKFFKEILN